ncbi:hypothetical protein, partial [Streptomyces sp. NPDC056128]|uniref:hypothetical protein n=1 Tax=Streptomyces sp. NPDC056128 TaxID=3345721 RepID=UPI0035DB2546
RHSGPPPARTQLTARKQATDYVGGPSRNFEAKTEDRTLFRQPISASYHVIEITSLTTSGEE